MQLKPYVCWYHGNLQVDAFYIIKDWGGIASLFVGYMNGTPDQTNPL